MTRHRPLGPSPDQPAVSAADPAGSNAEARMRRALGLDSRAASPRAAPARATDAAAPTRHRHRFVSDGEVPVVMMNPRTEQPSAPRADAAAMQSERDARQRAEQALAGAQATIRELQGKLAQAQTTLAHVTLARDEAVAALHQAQEQAAASRAAAPPPEPDAAPILRRRGRPPKPRAEKPPAKPRARTQKPVKWWVKGWRSALVE